MKPEVKGQRNTWQAHRPLLYESREGGGDGPLFQHVPEPYSLTGGLKCGMVE